MVNASGCKTILILDNNENVLAAFEKLFGDAGFTTRATWSGYTALSLIKSSTFGALLIYDYLADIHSAEFLGRLSRLSAKPPVVVMQGRLPTRADRYRYDSLGALAVAHKGDVEHVREVVALCCAPAPISKVIVN